MKRDLLSIVMKEGADFHQIQVKAADHIWIKSRTTKNPALVKLVELKQSFRKNDKYLVYLINDRRINNGPTYVFKTSQIYHEIASELNINSGHLMRNQFVNFDLS